MPTGEWTFQVEYEGQTYTHTFTLVSTNAAPFVAQAVDDITLILGGEAFRQDLTTIFSDPNGDALTFSAGTNNAAVALPSLSADILIVEAVGGGTATITASADDSNGGRATTSFEVNVPTGVATEDETELPTDYALEAAYPNPFNPQTTIRFALPQATEVRFVVYGILGREVARLLEGTMAAGRHEAVFDAASLPTGVYLYRLQADDFVQTRRMLLVK